MSSLEYRPDIDGLRAIAVCSVLLAHAELGVTGGYLGVDVFFVISGYLITGLIKKQLDAGSFSLADFWVRRVRRILPAACATVALTLIAGAFLLLPVDFRTLANSAFAQQLMLANVYFFGNTDYFDGPAELMPLLHTWSLAVEEQFYLGFPLVLMLLSRKWGRRTNLIWLLALAALSFAVAEVMMAFNPSLAFYLLPGRIWELVAGAVLVYLPGPARWSIGARQAASALGLTAIAACAMIYDEATRFPGAAALVPTLGAALLIYANSERDTLAYRALSLRPVVFVGLISYSLYLVHWPLMAFARYSVGEALPLSYRFWLVGASFPLAFLSWRFIETPFRTGFRGVSRRVVGLAALGSVSVVACSALAISFAQGLPGRLPAQAAKVLNTARIARVRSADLKLLRTGKLRPLGVEKGDSIDFLLWGDSHAIAVSGLIDQIAKEQGLSGLLTTEGGTAPLLGVWRPAKGTSTIAWVDEVMGFVKKKHVRNVILVARWDFFTEGRTNGAIDGLITDDASKPLTRENARAAFATSLERTVRELRTTVDSVWIVEQPPTQNNPSIDVVRAVVKGVPVPDGISIAAHQNRIRHVHASIAAVANEADRVFTIDLAKFFWMPNGRSRIGTNDGVFYNDGHHLSKLGVETMLPPAFKPMLISMRVERAKGPLDRPAQRIALPAHAVDPLQQ